MTTFPNFYQPNRIGTLFYPDISEIASDAENSDMPEAIKDHFKTLLLIVDMQIDFCHPNGALYVPGAESDIRRLIEFIFRNAGRISKIVCSLDSHLPYQIFHPAWWTDENDRSPEPFTVVSSEDLDKGKWKANFLPTWSSEYVARLQERSKKELVIWPYHVPIGGIGHALDPELWSAIMWHSFARKSQPIWLKKGSNPQTEHYSIFKPEVPVPQQYQDEESEAILNIIKDQDAVFIAGEAESHCVLETLFDIVQVLSDNPKQLSKLYVLRDCMSPVIHPEIDFHALAEARFGVYEKMGVNFISSKDDLPF